MSICKRLGKNLGGSWTYHAPCYWQCDDGKRSVVRCSAGVDEFDEPLGPPQMWLYGDGEPRRAEQYIATIIPTFIVHRAARHPQR